MKNYTYYISLLFSLFFIHPNVKAQCSGSLTVSSTSVSPGTTINASATGWMEDYEWYAEGGTSPQVTWNGNNTWSTTFNTPGVYNLCVGMWCDDWGDDVVQIECVEIIVTNPDGSYPDNANHCDSDESAPSDLISNAPLICNLDEHCATTIDYCGPASSCSPQDISDPENVNSWTIENNSWVKFIAATTTACFDLDITCIPSSGVGIQWAIVSWNGTNGPNGFTQMAGQNTSTTNITGTTSACATNLTIGNTYYLTIDGHNGSLCNYTISADNGIYFPPPPIVTALANGVSPLDLCDPIPTTISLTASGGDGTNYEWNVNGSSLGTGSNINYTLPIVTGGETITIEVESPSTGDVCNTSPGGTVSANVDVNICIELPVELHSFELHCQRSGVLIEWITMSENNNDYFIIEKMNESDVFEVIATINGVGYSTSVNKYNFLDIEKSRNNNNQYYRLSQVDFDGTKEILSTRTIACSSETVTVYPNPFKEQIIINLGDFLRNSNGKIEIINTLGQVVYTEKTLKNQTKSLINTQMLVNGFYIIKIKSDNHSHVERIIKE